MLAKHSKLFFALSLGALVASIVLATWGFPKIISKQIQKDPATLHDQSSSAAIAQHRNRPTIQRNCSDSPPRMATPGFKREHDENRLAARLSLEGGYQPRSKPTTG
ncbi:hypothetical protein ACJJTC_011360 [Scirpophaga incertulas]